MRVFIYIHENVLTDCKIALFQEQIGKRGLQFIRKPDFLSWKDKTGLLKGAVEGPRSTWTNRGKAAGLGDGGGARLAAGPPLPTG